MSLEMLKEVGLNVIDQIMFFIIVIIIPYLAYLFVLKNNNISMLLNEIDERNSVYEKTNLQHILNLFDKIYVINVVILSWTVHLLNNIIRYLIDVITFGKPKLTVKIIGGERDEYGLIDGFKGQLLVKWDCNRNSNLSPCWNPIRVVGQLLSVIVTLWLCPFLSVVLLSLILPQTFSSLSSAFSNWLPMFREFNTDFFIKLYNCFVDVVWDKFVVGGFMESPVLFVVFILIFVFFLSDGRFDLQGMLGYLPWTIVIVSIINVLFAMFNAELYELLVYYANAFGLAVLFITLVKDMAYIVRWCTVCVIRRIIDKVLPT